MLLLSVLLAMSNPPSPTPPVPGLCTDPVPADKDTAGCYKTNEIELDGAPPTNFRSFCASRELRRPIGRWYFFSLAEEIFYDRRK